MNPILKGVLSVLGGLIVGSIVNMGLIFLGNALIPLPDGIDPTNLDSLRAQIDNFELQHFIFPFLAHALGTLVGAFLAAKLSTRHPLLMAMIVGIFFLAGGISNVFSIGGPAWFIALDLIVAYLPMAWLGWFLAGKPTDQKND